MAEDRDEASFFSSLAGFSLGSVLSEMEVNTSGLSNQLGLQGMGFDLGKGIADEEPTGRDTGDDWEEEVDREMREEGANGMVATPVGGPRSIDMKPLMPLEHMEVISKKQVEPERSVYDLFPSFRPDKVLPFTEIFASKPVRKRHYPTRTATIELVTGPPSPPPGPETGNASKPGPGQRNLLSEDLFDIIQPVLPRKRAEWETEGSIDDTLRRAILKRRKLGEELFDLDMVEDVFDPVMIAPWEKDIMWKPPNKAHVKHTDQDDSQPHYPEYNAWLDSDDWAKSIMWTPSTLFKPFLAPPKPVAVAEKHEQPTAPIPQPLSRKARLQQSIISNRAAQQVKDKFNLSNDHMYETLHGRGVQRGVRQTFGNLEVQHAYPAQKLQLPFFKTRLGKSEARAWHRPALLFPTDMELRFSRVRKRDKDKSKRNKGEGQEMRRTSDLTLKDGSNYLLWEFSEEFPPIMSSIGMGAILVNYYRKRTEGDDHVPKADVGVAFVLEPKDESPFLKFGSAEPGQMVPTLYNNLIRAPLFRHKPYATDFLVVRSTQNGETKYFLREIKNLFVVGQTYPVVPVPGPHSRAITTTIKKRLEGIVYRLLKKSKQERIKISRLMKYFPDQNELQMRGRLKELMEYNRRGEHQGYWRLKSKHTLLPDSEIIALVTPESVVLCEAMQVGQRHLLDAGYGQAADGAGEEAEAGEGEDGEGMGIEQQLAPWIATKNFINATQNKAMLKLHGEGDPTGRGEAFSFVRVSMKEIFIRAGEDAQEKIAEANARPKNAHRYNVQQQQQIYRSEIERIWKAQYDSLSSKIEPDLDVEEEEPMRGSRQPSVGYSAPKPITFRDERQFPTAHTAFSPPVRSPLAAGPSYVRGASEYSRGSSADLERDMEDDMLSQGGVAANQASANRVLRIRRMQPDGSWKTEIVRDENVINVYIRARRNIEEENMMPDVALPTGDATTDTRMRKRLEAEISRMKRNQERRLTRKNQSLVKSGGRPIQLDRPAKADTSRRCGNCGQIGHMKTNRKCPRYAEFNPVPTTATPIAASPPAAHAAFPSFSTPGLARQASAFGFPNVSSPLATSPPLVRDHAESPGARPPKLKITIKNKT
ncbi:hypothetical protein DACRYDRAFT_117598 [Dacryopinax primogenitus]|uniref:Transcription initiation factor TFIID subunit 1 histone acetyltransferase domain-containing protein n=1 Tax=Dacryopinax primogenitus (strain DJM 731) TaxID=1858805 RepID=M5G8A1_DACPD|nr:uncharacterized protein DACRYDRAFT_117598 [Dacryopinax primogenitus]EJT99982.1 hypothetical protein DACRYDRAFT_117598 [Dacryopinax primogenitus]